MSERRKRRTDAVNAFSSSQQANGSEMEIDFLELTYRLLANWKLIICLALVGAVVMGIYTFFLATPMYEATSIIYVLNRSDSAINMADLQIGTALTSDYTKVFKMWEVHEEVISNLNLPYSYKQMQSRLSITNDSNTRMLDITFTSPDPLEAANAANEYAKVASRYIADTMQTEAPSIMSVARVPVNPVSPSKVRNVMYGGILGGFAACAYVSIVFILDDKYKTAEDIRKYAGLTTLAAIPAEHTEDKKSSRRH